MEDYEFYSKYTDNICIVKNKYQWKFNLCPVWEDKFLLDSSAVAINPPKYGFGIVHTFDEIYYIDLEGNRKFENLQIKYCYPFTKYEKALVYIDESKGNFITSRGTLLFSNSFDNITSTRSDYLFYGTLNNTQFIIDIKQELLFQRVWDL